MAKKKSVRKKPSLATIRRRQATAERAAMIAAAEHLELFDSSEDFEYLQAGLIRAIAAAANTLREASFRGSGVQVKNVPLIVCSATLVAEGFDKVHPHSKAGVRMMAIARTFAEIWAAQSINRMSQKGEYSDDDWWFAGVDQKFWVRNDRCREQALHHNDLQYELPHEPEEVIETPEQHPKREAALAYQQKAFVAATYVVAKGMSESQAAEQFGVSAEALAVQVGSLRRLRGEGGHDGR